MDRETGFAAFVAIVILVASLYLAPRMISWLLSRLAAKAATVGMKYSNEHPSAFQAATSGNASILAEIIASEIDINGRDIYGRTLLHCATINKHLDVVDLLLREGAKTDLTVTSAGKEVTALNIAACLKWHEGVELLLRYGAQMELEAELLLGGLTFVRTFLDDGGDPDHLFSGKPLMCMAARDGDIDLIQLLLEAGANINACDSNLLGWTPLLWTAQGLFLSEQRQMQLAELLLHRGADIEQPDNCRLRPLHVAAKSGATEIVKLLLDNGADIEANSNAGTPLQAAAEEGHAETIAILLDRDAKCDRRNGLGETALHIAVNKGHIEAVRVLLHYGADVRLNANFFVPVLQLAPDRAMTDLLKSYGAR